MAIEQIIDHFEKAKDRIPGFMRGAVNYESLLESFSSEIQELETVFFQLLDERHLSVAVGAQLDGIGQILDLERTVGETDSNYRARLVARSGELAKGGEIETLIDAYLRLTEATFLVVKQTYPARVEMTAHYDGDPEDPAADQSTVDAMNNVKAGGVELDLRYAPETTYFWFSDASEVDGSDNGPQSADHGLGDDVLTEGGGLARKL